jgi:Ecdysteroid kinase-like family
VPAGPAGPAGPADRAVTAAWLTSALARGRGGPGAVTTADAHPFGEGVGLLSALHRVRMTWSDGAGPASIVLKRPALGARSRAVAVGLGMYRNEALFYRHLGPTAALAVGCRHASYDEASGDFVLALDDMAGSATVDQVQGCTADDAAVVVAALAAHHAAFWDEAGLDGHGWLRPVDDAGFVEPLRTAYRDAWPAMRARFGAELPAAALEAGDRLGDEMPALAARLAAPPRTLAHGDVRADNMFFTPVGVRLCDWQLVDRSRGLRDLGYFLSQSLPPDVRAAHEGKLVELYVDRLAAAGVRGYGVADAWDDYRVAARFTFAYPVVAGGGLDVDDERGSRLVRTILLRSAAAIAAIAPPEQR